MFNQNSFYDENFRVQLQPYQGIDYSQIACMFPGNGSLYPGIFKSELKRLPLCMQRLREIDEFCLQNNFSKVSDFFLNPEKVLEKDMAIMRGMALIVIESSLFETYFEKRSLPKFLTGHSLGECSALVCAGVLDLKSMIKVTFQRELIGERHHVFGSMLAIAISAEQLKKLNIPVPYHLANENSPEQTVVSIETKYLKELSAFLRSQRIAARELKGVSRPYHSPLMQVVSDKIKEWLKTESFDLKPVQIPFLSSVNQKLYPCGYQLSFDEFSQIICEELTRPVLFQKQIMQLYDLGCRSFLEIGVSDAYVHFANSILHNHEHNAISLHEFLKSENAGHKLQQTWSIDVKKSPLFSVLAKYISKVTGYELVEIGAEDQFQEDLRIDSIKKAEIIFRTLEETQTRIDESVSLAQLKSVGDVVEYLDKLQQAPLFKNKKQDRQFVEIKKQWLACDIYRFPRQISDVQWFHLDLSPSLTEQLQRLKVWLMSDPYRQKQVCFCYDANVFFDLNADWVVDFSVQIKNFVTAVNSENFAFNLWLTSNREDKVYQSLKVFLKSLAKERKLAFKSVIFSDIQQANAESFFNIISSRADIKSVLLSELQDPSNIDVLYKNGQRYVIDLMRASIQNNDSLSVSSLVVIGGARGLAFEILAQLPASKKTKLVVLGRTPMSSPEIEKNLKTLKNKFTDFLYIQVDATDFAKLNDAFALITKKIGPIDVVINSAGVENSRRIEEKNENEIRAEAKTKLLVTDHLQRLQNEIKFRLVHFASIVGEFGNEGQTIYALGNGYQAGQEQAVSVMWPGLDKVGMMSNVGLLQMVKTAGATLLPVQQAAAWFDKLIHKKMDGPVFYVDPKDLLLLEFYLRNSQDFSKCIGQLHSPSELIFRKNFNIKDDSFLVDHLIETSIVVPASFAMATMLNAGRLLYKKYPRLFGFEIKNVMMLIDNQELNCFSQYQVDENMKMSAVIVSQMEHFCGQMEKQSADTYDKIVTLRPPQDYDMQVDLKTVYRKECIDFGPKFQAVHQAYYNSKTEQVIALGHLQTVYMTGHADVDALMGIFEVAFQVTSLAGLLKSKGLAIPLKIGAVEIYHLQYQQVFAVPEIVSMPKSNGVVAAPLQANVLIYNESGQCVMQIKNLEMSVIRIHEELPFEFITKHVRI